MWHLVIAKERTKKQGLVAEALFKHFGPERSSLCFNDPPLGEPFIAAGQLWVVERIVPHAMKHNTRFWLIDNGYYKTSGRGHGHDGHYEMTYKGLTPILMNEPDFTRFPYEQHVEPWRTQRGGHILLCLPGPTFGKVIGLDMERWMAEIKNRIRRFTKRPILVRKKWSNTPLSQDLDRAHVVVTHSSNVAVDAVRYGVPAIVAPTNPAAPVCSTNLADMDKPWMPDRSHWWASLMSQQYTAKEMSDGTAWKFMQRVMEQVDGA